MNIDSFQFDLTDCSLKEQSGNHRGWMNSVNVSHSLRFESNSVDWQFDLTQPDVAAEFYRKQCIEYAGAMLSCTVINVAGVEALQGLFKYHAPIPGSLAMYYVGILWIPFHNCYFQLNIEAMERGMTGGREAVIMMLGKEIWPKPDAPTLLAVKNSTAIPIRVLPSDDEKYDSMFPDHPLSMVRSHLSKIVATARFDKDVRSLKTFRWKN